MGTKGSLDMVSFIDAWRFINTTAELLKDGEVDEDGVIFEMENDDAVDTLHNVISGARALLDLPDRYLEEVNDDG